jgi:uncharacterized integral membrane protein
MDTEHEPPQPPPAVPPPAQPEPAQPEPAQPELAESDASPAPEPEPAHEAAPTPEPDAAFQPSFYAKLAVLLFVLGYSIAFIVGNDTTIPVDFVFATARVSLIWTILLLLAVGFVGGALGSQLYRHHRSKQRRES